ncbi:uncharacterized protein LOC113938167 [Zalophus californianus]|uniref:Uncharacterized protein LOC113938167 n=1 Tax=Zalophus californianus TaxID=9704 RepID=A0A6J2FGR3_ZALCA|nr:uncharacterized protein LOC113938167 [Zalophus californianus]
MFYQLGEDSVNVKQLLACQMGTCVTQGPLPSHEATGTVLLPGVVGTHFGARLLQVRDLEAGGARGGHGAIMGPTAHISVQDPVRRRYKEIEAQRGEERTHPRSHRSFGQLLAIPNCLISLLGSCAAPFHDSQLHGAGTFWCCSQLSVQDLTN